MKFEVFSLNVKSIGKDYSPPVLTSVKAQKGESLLCGLLFSNPALLRIPLDANGNCKLEDGKVLATPLAVEEQAGEGFLGVFNGLGPSASGEAVCTLLHEGFLPGFMKGLLGKSIKGKKDIELWKFLQENESTSSALRHSVVHVEPGGGLRSRSFKESGILWDVAQVGDFVFGLSQKSIWREPYLKPDKREFLRSDLLNNFNLHRDEEGYFWFLNEQGRLLRMGLTDIKAQPTPLKTKSKSGLFVSSASVVDSWLYVTADDSKTLMRIRRNPISREEESQIVFESEFPITAIQVVDHPEVRKVFFTTSSASHALLYSFQVVDLDDRETLAPVPPVEKILELESIKTVGSLTLYPQPHLVLKQNEGEDTTAESQRSGASSHRDFDWGPKPVLWGSVGCLGQKAESSHSQILRISDL